MKEAWTQESLDHACVVSYGERVIKKHNAGTLYPVYGGGGETFRIDRFNREDCTIISRFGMSESCVRHVPGRFFLNDSGLSVHPKDPARLLPRFLDYFLYAYQKLIYSLGRGSAQKNLDVKAFRKIFINYPIRLAEQKCIVTILDDAFSGIDAAIMNTEKNLANAKALVDGYLDRIFVHAYQSQPKRRLSEICTFSSGGTPTKRRDEYWNGAVPWISGRDMKSTRIFDANLHVSELAVAESATRVAPIGSLLILVRGMGLAHGAQIAELMTPCAFNQDIKAIKPEDNVIPRYLVLALISKINSSEGLVTSAAHGTLKMDAQKLKEVSVAVPPRERQVEIVEHVDDLISKTEHLKVIYQRKRAALVELKQSLLQKAFNGELTAEKTETKAREATA